MKASYNKRIRILSWNLYFNFVCTHIHAHTLNMHIYFWLWVIVKKRQREVTVLTDKACSYQGYYAFENLPSTESLQLMSYEHSSLCGHTFQNCLSAENRTHGPRGYSSLYDNKMFLSYFHFLISNVFFKVVPLSKQMPHFSFLQILKNNLSSKLTVADFFLYCF